MILAALALASIVHAEPAQRIFAHGDKAAAVYAHEVDFFVLPPDTMAMVGGRSAFGPLAENGMLLFWPELQPAKVIRFAEPISKPDLPERNGPRFTVCTDPRLGPAVAEGKGYVKYCGVMGIDGRIVYSAPASGDESVEALALTDFGHEALFQYLKGKDIAHYLVWNEKTKKTKTYKADPRDMELRRTLNRFGLGDWNPEPEKNPKPEPNNELRPRR